MTHDKPLIARFDADPMLEWRVDDTVDLVRSKPADYAPDAKVVHSYSNDVLLGVVLEKVSGQSVTDHLRTRILEPLGLTGTAFPTDDQPRRARPSCGRLPAGGGKGTELDRINQPSLRLDFRAMISTAPDLARWAEEMTPGHPDFPRGGCARGSSPEWASTTDTASA